MKARCCLAVALQTRQTAAIEASLSAVQTSQDVFKSWVRHVADAWNTTDWRVVAKSGIGVLPNEFGLGMKDRFPCRQWSSLWCTTLWDFQLWQADVVLVYLGTNDFHLGSPSGAEFQSAYVEFLMLVRSKYPQAMVLCIVPLLYSCSQESKWQTMLESLTEAVKGLEDKKVRLQFTGPTKKDKPIEQGKHEPKVSLLK